MVFVWLKANMPTMPDAVIVFQKAKLLFARKAANAGGVNFRIRNVSKFIAIELDF
jgi:glutamate dehydrogenase/leucine dehydrogenase